MNLQLILLEIEAQPVGTLALASKGAIWIRRDYGWIRPGWVDRAAFISNHEMASQIHRSKTRNSAPAEWTFL